MAPNLPSGDHDRVVMASRKPDGTPDQTPDFEFIGPADMVEEMNAEQLRQQKVSAADVAIRGVTSGPGPAEDSDEEDPTIAELKDAHADAEKAADKQAATEVKQRHEGLGDPDAGSSSADKASSSKK